ncbi:hypothetical protein N784_09610 [Pontibacillus litoralis JSM 072002]|uniref:Uncharacterized protein n=1 Tax=Pontibacillus litoralis JSM 072002 TaxID=1385512 RepID=A0A0A5HNS2_9BACI|nr:hypothetical protein N784_09610 [Pontibacillus litoralis JSM 072002]
MSAKSAPYGRKLLQGGSFNMSNVLEEELD